MRMNKVYVGFRPGGPDSNEVNVSVVEDGDARELDGRLDLKSHSPSGFRWGSSGNGAAQLALAILADATGSDDYAARHHHWFKLEVVSVLPREAWKLTGGEVMAWNRAAPSPGSTRPGGCREHPMKAGWLHREGRAAGAYVEREAGRRRRVRARRRLRDQAGR